MLSRYLTLIFAAFNVCTALILYIPDNKTFYKFMIIASLFILMLMAMENKTRKEERNDRKRISNLSRKDN